MNKPLSLSDHQPRQIHAAAKALLPLQRSDFVHGVKRSVKDLEPSRGNGEFTARLGHGLVRWS
jgi:hypothetical protein